MGLYRGYFLATITTFYYPFLFIIGQRTIQKLQLKGHLKPEHSIRSKISAFHIYLYLFNYPILFILFICSLGIKFCFRHHLDV